MNTEGNFFRSTPGGALAKKIGMARVRGVEGEADLNFVIFKIISVFQNDFFCLFESFETSLFVISQNLEIDNSAKTTSS